MSMIVSMCICIASVLFILFMWLLCYGANHPLARNKNRDERFKQNKNSMFNTKSYTSQTNSLRTNRNINIGQIVHINDNINTYTDVCITDIIKLKNDNSFYIVRDIIEKEEPMFETVRYYVLFNDVIKNKTVISDDVEALVYQI